MPNLLRYFDVCTIFSRIRTCYSENEPLAIVYNCERDGRLVKILVSQSQGNSQVSCVQLSCFRRTIYLLFVSRLKEIPSILSLDCLFSWMVFRGLDLNIFGTILFYLSVDCLGSCVESLGNWLHLYSITIMISITNV